MAKELAIDYLKNKLTLKSEFIDQLIEYSQTSQFFFVYHEIYQDEVLNFIINQGKFNPFKPTYFDQNEIIKINIEKAAKENKVQTQFADSSPFLFIPIQKEDRKAVIFFNCIDSDILKSIIDILDQCNLTFNRDYLEGFCQISQNFQKKKRAFLLYNKKQHKRIKDLQTKLQKEKQFREDLEHFHNRLEKKDYGRIGELKDKIDHLTTENNKMSEKIDILYVGQKVDIGTSKERYDGFLMPDEDVKMEFLAARDGAIFTDKRMIIFNPQGVRGKKVALTSILWKNVTAFEIENSGTFDLDAELKLWGSGFSGMQVQFARKTDVKAINQFICEHIMG